MKRFLLILLLSFGICGFSQSETSIGYIGFEFSHSLRIGYNVSLEISVVDHDGIPILVISKDSYLKDDRLREDKIIRLFQKEYDRIIEEVEKINAVDTYKNLNFQGWDGTTTKLVIAGEMWSLDNEISLSFWSPDVATDERGLGHYYEACRLIIKAAGLDPDDYF